MRELGWQKEDFHPYKVVPAPETVAGRSQNLLMIMSHCANALLVSMNQVIANLEEIAVIVFFSTTVENCIIQSSNYSTVPVLRTW